MSQPLTACITGANRGIGFELTKQLAKQGLHVYALCRRSSPSLDALTSVSVIEEVDVTDMDSISRGVSQIDADHIHYLINNAGLLKRTSLEGISNQDISLIQRQFEVNALGPLLVTQAILPKLTQDSKVALITSRMGSISDNTSGSHYGYRMSKAALNAAGKSLSLDLASMGIPVAILHPGWIKTDMTGHTGNDSPETAARQLLERIYALSIETTGTFWHANGDILPW